MPAPNTGANSDMEVNSSGNDVSDIILMPSEDSNIDTFSSLPIDFDSSNSSLGTMELKNASAIPMLTDIAEETVYETDEFFDETIKVHEDCDKNEYFEEKFVVTTGAQNKADLSNIFLESPPSIDANAKLESDEIDHESNSVEEKFLENVETYCSEDSNSNVTIEDGDYDSNADTILISSEMPDGKDSGDVSSLISAPLDDAGVVSSSEVSNLITISKNTNLASELLDNIALNNVSCDGANMTIVSNETNSNLAISGSSISSGMKFKKISSPKVINASTYVPITIASQSIKRSADTSVGQPSSNLITKVIVSQNKLGQPLVLSTSGSVLSTTTNNSSSILKPVTITQPTTITNSNPTQIKSITAAQARNLGLKLHQIKASPSKAKLAPVTKSKIVFNTTATHPVVQTLQTVLKSAQPAKILPAPLVSKQATTSVNQPKIFVSQDYLMKGNMLVPKPQSSQQVVAFSNHTSPKKQVQYIQLSVGSLNLPTVTTAKGKVTPISQNIAISKINKDTPVIVATSGVPLKSANSPKTITPGSISVLPKSTPGQRFILPAVSKTKSDSVSSMNSSIDGKQVKMPANIVVVSDDIIEKGQQTKLEEDEKRMADAKTSALDQDDAVAAHETTRNVPKSPTKHINSSETGNGLRSRKPCNCTRSQCLKLYCECFANGEFCNNCNCVSCHNNLSHEENRQHAIRSCLDRNPQAFRPKIGKCLVGVNDRRHTKGCHCKRSGCLKNYCECYEAQIPCSDNCKCQGCKNIDEMLFASSCVPNNAFDDTEKEFQTSFTKNKLTAEINDAVGQTGSSNPRHAFSFIKDQVVEATCQCLLAQADEVKRRNINVEDGQKYILEEFGRCLIQIIECAPDKYASS